MRCRPVTRKRCIRVLCRQLGRQLGHTRSVLAIHFPRRDFLHLWHLPTKRFFLTMFLNLAVSCWLLLVLIRFFHSLTCIRYAGSSHEKHSKFFCLVLKKVWSWNFCVIDFLVQNPSIYSSKIQSILKR